MNTRTSSSFEIRGKAHGHRTPHEKIFANAVYEQGGKKATGAPPPAAQPPADDAADPTKDPKTFNCVGQLVRAYCQDDPTSSGCKSAKLAAVGAHGNDGITNNVVDALVKQKKPYENCDLLSGAPSMKMSEATFNSLTKEQRDKLKAVGYKFGSASPVQTNAAGQDRYARQQANREQNNQPPERQDETPPQRGNVQAATNPDGDRNVVWIGSDVDRPGMWTRFRRKVVRGVTRTPGENWKVVKSDAQKVKNKTGHGINTVKDKTVAGVTLPFRDPAQALDNTKRAGAATYRRVRGKPKPDSDKKPKAGNQTNQQRPKLKRILADEREARKNQNN